MKTKILYSIFAVVFIIIAFLVFYSCLRAGKLIYTPLAIAGGTNISISSPLDGIVEEIYAVDFAKVKKGQPLIKLNEQEIKFQIQEIEIKIKILENQLEKAKMQINSQQDKIKALQEKLIAEKLELKNIKRQEKLFSNLVARSIVSKNFYYNLHTSKLVSIQKIKTSVADLFSAKSILLKTREIYEITKENIALKELTLKQLNFQLKETLITSPADGYIENINVIKQQYIKKGTQITRLDIIDKNQTLVKAIFTEDQIKYIKIGQKACVKFDINPDIFFYGTVIDIAKTTMNTQSTSNNSNTKNLEIWNINYSEITKTNKYIVVLIKIPENIEIDNTVIVEGMSATVIVYKTN